MDTPKDWVSYVRAEHIRSYADLVENGLADADLSDQDRRNVVTILRGAADYMASRNYDPASLPRWRLHDAALVVANLAEIGPFDGTGRAVEIIRNM